jgi:ABC-type multidrug transport system fused ATPase/permease subunit
MISHSISTIKDCDIIIVLEEEKISSIGSYESLIKESEILKNRAAEI